MRELSLTNCRLDKRYDVQHQLGRGSYAEIFVAQDIMASSTSPHNCVVIKALNVFLQNDLDPDLERTLVENFQNEAIGFVTRTSSAGSDMGLLAIWSGRFFITWFWNISKAEICRRLLALAIFRSS